jgi:hypothetical protein
MFTQPLRWANAIALGSVLLTATFVGAQSQESLLKITRPGDGEKPYSRSGPPAQLTRETVFNRINPVRQTSQLKSRRSRDGGRRENSLATPVSASAPQALSIGTGGGDINEVEPNDLTAQNVSLPVNVFGDILVNGDVDFFAFQALAGQQITIEPFAARLAHSQLIAGITLFDSSGGLLATRVGDENTDPVIRYISTRDEVLVAGITDADNLGGRSFDYVLNITRGNDVDEQEPNDRIAQTVRDLPATIFGDITGRADVDFYSFSAVAGQTLIVDVDAEVLGSRLDPEINLLDPETGVEFFYNDQYDGDDPRFNIVLPYDGRYVIGIGSFNSNSSGFYRLNASLVPSTGAPLITSVTRLAKKLIEVTGVGFTAGSVVEVNSSARRTTFIDERTLRAKIKSRLGDVVTVSNPADNRRSNPLIVQ